jgi:hypothetical protein
MTWMSGCNVLLSHRGEEGSVLVTIWRNCSCAASFPTTDAAQTSISRDSCSDRFPYVNSFGLACPILSAVCRIDVFLFSWQSGDDIRGSHLLGSATSKGCDYGTLARETQRVSDALPKLGRSSRSISWPYGTDPGDWRLSRGPGVERQGCPKQKGTQRCQVEARLIQIDHVTRMRKVQ